MPSDMIGRMKHVTIQGHDVPALGLGTWDIRGNAGVRSIIDALAAGYRHIDTAQIYENEVQVGQGIKGSDVPREEVFLTTKIQPDKFSGPAATKAVQQSLRDTGTDYIDLMLLHWPSRSVPVGETLSSLVKLQDAGLIKHIGLSNFNTALVKEAARHATIFNNQIEYHPYLTQQKISAQARKMDYLLTAYSPLCKRKVLDDPALTEIGHAHGKSPVQVTLRWLIQQPKVAAIPKAAGKHQAANLDIFDFELSTTEMQRIHGLACGDRIVAPGGFTPDWDEE